MAVELGLELNIFLLIELRDFDFDNLRRIIFI